MKLIKNVLTIALLGVITLSTNSVKAQDFGADVVSSYVWRGTQFGAGPAVQPWFTLPTISENLELGIWGSFPLTEGLNTANDPSGDPTFGYPTYELDLYASYDFGPIALTVTNYTFPGVTGAYEEDAGLFEDDGLEVSASASVGPLGLTVGYFTEAGALYVEAGATVAGIDIAVGFGSDDDNESSDFYVAGEDESGLVNISFGGSKEVKITEDYSLPLFGSFIYNPTSESAFMVFGMSF